ncbi:MAG TPA: histidinol-phosphate transaminase [Thermoanaerobaculia bacterium]
MNAAAADPVSWVRPEVRALKAYHLDLTPSRYKLDQNEVPFDLPRALKRRVAALLLERSWARYPDFHSDALRAALGRLHGWPAAGVLVGCGSNELLGVALEALAGPGREVLATRPSFSLYETLIVRAHAAPRYVTADEDLRLPLARLREAVDEDPRRPLLLCSPNNPTGDALTAGEVDDLLGRLSAPLLLDNAYGEFCDHDYRPLLDRHRHLILFRTFSKAWSLGGLRLGYLLADPALAAELLKVKLPYNVSFVSAAAGEAILEARQAAERRVRVLLGRRPQWASMLSAAGFQVYPSQANFLLARHRRAPEIGRALDRRGIRVRVLGGHPVLAECLRFSVGDGPALRAVRAALREILGDTR